MALVFRVTDAGLAAATSQAALGLRLAITSFKLGSGYNYTPNGTETALAGSVLYTDAVSSYKDMPDGSIVFVLSVLPSAGPFNFGEIGIYTDTGILFALGVFPTLQAKYTSISSNINSTFTFNCHMNLSQRATQLNLSAATVPSSEIYLNWSQIVPRTSMPDPRVLSAIVNELDSNGNVTPLMATPAGDWAVTGNMTLIAKGFTPAASTTTYMDITKADWIAAIPGNVATTVTAVNSGGTIVVQGPASVFRKISSVAVVGNNVRLTYSVALTTALSGSLQLLSNDFGVDFAQAAVEQSVTGVSTVSVTSANQALTSYYSASSGVLAEARSSVLVFTTTTTAPFTVYAPPGVATKYIVKNTAAYSVTLANSTVLGNTTSAGTPVTVAANSSMVVMTDGTNFSAQLNTLPSLTLTSALALNSGGTAASTAAGARTNLDVPQTNGTGATGTWGISISGNAATATLATKANTLENNNNYSISNILNFYNGGVGAGYIASADAVNGMIYRPSVSGSTAAHTWTAGNGAIIAALNSSGNMNVIGQYIGAGTGLTGTATSLNIGGTAAVATALNNTLDYAIKNILYFANGGSGSGYINASDAVNGMVYRPTVNGSARAHVWTNTAGAGLMDITSGGVLSAFQYNGAGTGLTGTAASLNIGGNAATASNLNGTVSGQISTNYGNGGPTVPANYSFKASGSYGGGISFVDGSTGMGIYSISGTMNFALGTATSISSQATLSPAGVFTAASFAGSGSGLTGTAGSLTANIANNLNAANNYTVNNTLLFDNAGVGSGRLVSNDGTWGMVHRPSINGSTGMHVLTDAGGSGIVFVYNSGVVVANGFSGVHFGSIDSAVTAVTQASSDNSNKLATTAFVKGGQFVKCWANFSGSSGAINGSSGVASITRTSGGEYIVNLSASQPNTTYSVFSNTNQFKLVCTHHNGRGTNYYALTVFDSTNGTVQDSNQVYTQLVNN